MQSREFLLNQFVINYFSGSIFTIDEIVGDAGLRNYYRVKVKERSYIVMDCPPEYASTKPFIFMSNFLIKNGFSAPEIIYSDIDNGFLILEDFGSLSVKRLLYKVNNQERKEIYYSTMDLLVDLHKIDTPKELKAYDIDLMLKELDLFVDYYIPYKSQKKISIEEVAEFKEICRLALKQQSSLKDVIILRDYHVENIMYLQYESKIKKLGLLDFQDALVGSPIYDVVSILEDARSLVSRGFALDCLYYYIDKMQFDKSQAITNYHILGAQRNLRILGVFARKYIQDYDNNYLQYIPTVLKYLSYDLSHTVLSPLQDWLLRKQII